MKKVSVLSLLILLTTSLAFGQMSKADRKVWKKQAKAFAKAPEGLKELSDAKMTAEQEVARLKSESAALKAAVEDKNGKITEAEEQLTRMRTDLAAARAELERMKNNMPLAGGSTGKGRIGAGLGASEDLETGVIFRVQIGAFRNKDMSKYFDNNPNFGGEAGKDTNEPQRLTIGIFRNYWEADTFKKYIREMGVKDAWIVPYKDGKRVDIKEVLDQVVTEKASDKD